MHRHMEAWVAVAAWLARWQWWLGGGVAVTGYLFGFSGNLILVAVIHLMALDLITGIIKGITWQALCSRKAYDGVRRKAAMLAAVALGHAVDGIAGTGDLCKRTLAMYVCGVEVISVLENIVAAGVLIPERLQEFLSSLLPSHAERKPPK